MELINVIVVIVCLARLGRKKDPVVQILISCHQEFGDLFSRQATKMSLSRLHIYKAPCRICGGFLLQNIFQTFDSSTQSNQCFTF